MTHKIIFIHGFGSNCLTDKKIKLDEMGYDVSCETVDHTDVTSIERCLTTLIKKHIRKEPIVIGHSLGGLWAYYLANKLGLRCILINPSFSPSPSISKNFDEAALKKLAEVRAAAFSSYPTECIMIGELGDETLDHNDTAAELKGRAKVVLVNGGDHRFKHFDDLQKAVVELSEAYIEN